MDLKRSVAVWILVLLLSLSLVGANLVTAGERTVLDPGFVKGALDEEDVYGEVRGVAVEALAEEQSAGAAGLPVGTGEVVNETLTEEYLEGEVERNVDRFYGYLHGDREELVLEVDLSPAKENLRESVRSDVSDIGLAELLAMTGGDPSVEAAGVSVDLSAMRGMAESEENFTRAREAFRGELRDAVLRGLVDEAFAAASDDQLLALAVEGYDPTGYSAAEKEAMVAEREGEIRAALRSGIEAERGDELDRAVEERMSEVRSVLLAELEGGIGGEELPPDVSEPLSDLVSAYVDGLTTDVTYGAFRGDVEDARTRLGDGVASLVDEAAGGQLPDRVDLAEEMGPGAERGLEQARSAVQVLDLLLVALPLVAAVLVGAVYAVSRSLAVTGFGAGSGLVVAGGSGYLSAAVGGAQLRRLVAEAGPGDVVSDVALALAGRVLDALAAQSLLLAVLGVVLLVASAVAWRRGGG